ncbi:hypothetical protein FG386_003079 [Cryptosporidium ryanae]|uniref:uncharacterized protein n=1 Tax=Cryptosporidium ryanae TaxID=515981 RepID=UPI00351A6A78|nr:hypothetical protein FG386_003079 [Cryptosporidium ryanae]
MWYIGISTALLSSISGGLGDNLIRLSYILENELDESERRPVVLRPMWLIGTFLSCILNAILVIISLNYTSAMVVTPFSGLHIFWSIIFSRYLLNEETKNRHYKGTFIVILGLLLIVMFGVKDVPAYTIYELEKLYVNPVFIVYCFLNLSLIMICMYVSFFGIVRDLVSDNSENTTENKLNTNKNGFCENFKVNMKTNSDGGDLILINKNALHLKISNIKNMISKGKNKDLDVTNPYNKVSDEYFNGEETFNKDYKNALEYKHYNEYNETVVNISKSTFFDEAETEDNLYMNNSEHNRNVNGSLEYYKNLTLETILYFDSKVKTITEIFERKSSNFPRIYVKLSVKRFCMCLVSGLCGGYTNILVQNLINVILLNGLNVLVHLLFYYLVTMIIILTCVQWLFWNSCLSSYQAIYVVPIINSVLIASSGFCNLILYYNIMNTLPENASSSFNGFNKYASASQICFLIGQFFIISGIYIISNRNMETLGDSFLFMSEIKKKLEEINYLKDYIKSKNRQINASLENLLGFYNKKMNLNSNDIRVYSQELVINRNNSHNKDNNSVETNDNTDYHFDNTIILPQAETHIKNVNEECEYENKHDNFNYSEGIHKFDTSDNNMIKQVNENMENPSTYVLDEYRDYCKMDEDFSINDISYNDNNNDFDESIIELNADCEVVKLKDVYYSRNNNTYRDKTSISTIDTNTSMFGNNDNFKI